MSLYQSVRPEKLDHIVGQPEAVTILKNAIASKDRQHAYLFHGPSGCGKTTMARILARELGCDVRVEGSIDYEEVNASDTRGIDDTRRIVRDSAYPPISCRRRTLRRRLPPAATPSRAAAGGPGPTSVPTGKRRSRSPLLSTPPNSRAPCTAATAGLRPRRAATSAIFYGRRPSSSSSSSRCRRRT